MNAKGATQIAEDAMDSDQERYLDYVRALHTRLAKRASESGITTWALLGALAFLLLQLPGSLAKVASTEWQLPVLILWAHLQAAAESAYLLARHLRGQNPVSRFDYRVSRVTSISDGILAGVLCILAFGLPAALSFIAAAAPLVSESQRLLLGINGWVFGSFALLAVVMLTWLTFSQKWSRFPAHLLLRQEQNAFSYVLGGILSFVITVIFFGNLYFACKLFLGGSTPPSEPITAIALALVFIVVVVRVLLVTLPNQRSLEWLERLERDIIIHKITASDIRERLEREHLGSELGAWLKTRIDDVRAWANEMQQFVAEAKGKIAEVDGLDENLLFEKRGRLMMLLELLDPKVKKLEEAWTPLSLWLKKIGDVPFQDTYLRDLARRTELELHQETMRALQDSRECLKSIRACHDKLRN